LKGGDGTDKDELKDEVKIGGSQEKNLRNVINTTDYDDKDKILEKNQADFKKA
jgi:hypothetical protein